MHLCMRPPQDEAEYCTAPAHDMIKTRRNLNDDFLQHLR
jgi:hypothetical protein